MSAELGAIPKWVYGTSDIANGVAPVAGTIIETADSSGRKQEFILCVVPSGQNLSDGTVVTFDGSYNVTVAAAGNPNANNSNRLGVCVCSVTASTSQAIWVQVFGHCSVLASASTLPNVTLSMSATAGRVDDATTSLSAAIAGMYLTATTGATGLTAAILNYPRFTYPSATLS